MTGPAGLLVLFSNMAAQAQEAKRVETLPTIELVALAYGAFVGPDGGALCPILALSKAD